MAQAKAATNDVRKRNRRDPADLLDEGACVAARRAASLAAAKIKDGQKAPSEVITALSEVTGMVMRWVHSGPSENGGG